MRRVLWTLALFPVVVDGIADAVTVELHVDSAPNHYRSPQYLSWWTFTKEGVSGVALST